MIVVPCDLHKVWSPCIPGGPPSHFNVGNLLQKGEDNNFDSMPSLTNDLSQHYVQYPHQPQPLLPGFPTHPATHQFPWSILPTDLRMCIPTSHWLLRKKSTERLKKGIQLPACSLEKSQGRSLSKREYSVTFVGARDQIERQLKERR